MNIVVFDSNLINWLARRFSDCYTTALVKEWTQHI